MLAVCRSQAISGPVDTSVDQLGRSCETSSGALGAYLTERAWPPRTFLGGRFSLVRFFHSLL